MRPHRNLKIGSLIERELSKILLADFNFDGALVTITEVDIPEDLLHATVKLGIIPYEKGPDVFQKLNAERRNIQHRLLRIMNIKPMPTIRFVIDETAT